MSDVCCLQVKGEFFVRWRQPRLRMPKRTGSRLKRVRSPPRHRGSPSSDPGASYTPTDEELAERRSKQRHDPRYANRARVEQPKKKRKVVDLTSEEEEDDQLQSPRGDDFELDEGFR